MAPKAVVFTDFDGTVTLQDSNDYLTENLGFGRPRRLEINDDILDSKLTFRDGFREMLQSIPQAFPDCVDYLLQHIELDPGFVTFFHWCEAQGIPVVVVLSGMKPIIYALLKKLVGDDAVKNIEIISNDVRMVPDALEWEIVFKDPESGFGHDKSKSIREYLAKHHYAANDTNLALPGQPILFYCGDGVLDLLAAKETNLLFAKHGKDLIKYCIRENIPYTEFDSFNDIHDKIVKIVAANAENIGDFIENA